MNPLDLQDESSASREALDEWRISQLPYPPLVSDSFEDILVAVEERTATLNLPPSLHGHASARDPTSKELAKRDSTAQVYADAMDAMVRSPLTLQHPGYGGDMEGKRKWAPHFSADLPTILSSQFNVGLLVPYLEPEQQLALLRAREKTLLCNLMAEKWERSRPPRDRWWELRDASFTYELHRSNCLLNSEGKCHLRILLLHTKAHMVCTCTYHTEEQLRCHQHRALLMDLYERARMENESMQK
jgi:hypothetical protein